MSHPNYDKAMIEWLIAMVREYYMVYGTWPSVAQVLESLLHSQT